MYYNAKSRKSGAFMASASGIIQQLVQILGSFAYRTFFLMILSKEYLGINGLFSNVLQLFSMAELGIGTAIQYNLYKAFAEKNSKNITALINFYKKVYLIIALIVFSLGLCFYPFITSIVNVSEIPQDVSLAKVYFLFVINSVASYLFVYKQSLLMADGRVHYVSFFSSGLFIVGSIVKIVVLYISRDFETVLAADILTTISLNFLFSFYITKKYKNFFKGKNKIEKSEKNQIYKNTTGLLCHKIGTILVTSTDNVVISKFVSLIAVGIYSNYSMIVSAVTGFVLKIMSSLVPTITNYAITESKEDSYTMLKRILYVNMCITSFSTICLYTLLNPFIKVWLDESFLLSQGVVALICLQHYLQTSRMTVNNFIYSYELFSLDKIRPLIESIVNLIVSIVLAIKFGVIGVLIGTCFSGIITYFWREPYLLFKKSLKRSSAEYWLTQLKWFMLTVVMCALLTLLFEFLPTGFVGLVIKLVLAAVSACVVILVLTVRSEEAGYFINIIKAKLERKK